jgi:hypothetical protein
MSKTRSVLMTLVLLLLGTALATAQAIPPVEVGERVLVNMASTGQSFAYEFNNEAESDTTMFVTYLGEPFPFLTEWYDSNGALLWYVPIDQAGASPALRLPPDTVTIVITGEGATGRATFSLGVDAPGELLFEPVDDGHGPDGMEGDDGFTRVPETGQWTLHLIDHENNCPNDILFENIWMPADGTTRSLAFSGDETRVALELHRFVAAQEIEEDPTFFEVVAGEFPGSWTVIPGIMTGPYTYNYTLSAPTYIQLDYIERLALSDCELTARYELVLDEAASGGLMPAATGEFFDLARWSALGDATDLTLTFDDPFAPDGRLCARDQQQGDTWYFEASPEVIAQINSGTDLLLQFDLRLLQEGSLFEDYDVMMTVGNGIVLVYDFAYAPTLDWTSYSVMLAAGEGWVDPDGGLPTDDPTLFAQMMADVTQLHIRGEYVTGADSACIANVNLIPFSDAVLGG